MPGLDAGSLDRTITIQRRTAGQDTAYGTATGPWVDFARNVPAQVQDVLPSKSEQLTDDILIANRPARIRIRYRPDITSDMRIIYGARTMQIIGGPAEIGRRDGLEMVAQDYSSAGDAP